MNIKDAIDMRRVSENNLDELSRKFYEEIKRDIEKGVHDQSECAYKSYIKSYKDVREDVYECIKEDLEEFERILTKKGYEVMIQSESSVQTFINRMSVEKEEYGLKDLIIKIKW